MVAPTKQYNENTGQFTPANGKQVLSTRAGAVAQLASCAHLAIEPPMCAAPR